MRKYKFRAWDKVAKRMIEHEQEFLPLKVTNFGVMRLDPRIEQDRWELTELDRFELMQFAGLHDKNGKEIYEGDILKILEVTDKTSNEYITPVIFEDCAFLVRSGKQDYDTFLGAWSGNSNNAYPLFEIEVVGNIYENPKFIELTK